MDSTCGASSGGACSGGQGEKKGSGGDGGNTGGNTGGKGKGNATDTSVAGEKKGSDGGADSKKKGSGGGDHGSGGSSGGSRTGGKGEGQGEAKGQASGTTGRGEQEGSGGGSMPREQESSHEKADKAADEGTGSDAISNSPGLPTTVATTTSSPAPITTSSTSLTPTARASFSNIGLAKGKVSNTSGDSKKKSSGGGDHGSGGSSSGSCTGGKGEGQGEAKGQASGTTGRGEQEGSGGGSMPREQESSHEKADKAADRGTGSDTISDPPSPPTTVATAAGSPACITTPTVPEEATDSTGGCEQEGSCGDGMPREQNSSHMEKGKAAVRGTSSDTISDSPGPFTVPAETLTSAPNTTSTTTHASTAQAASSKTQVPNPLSKTLQEVKQLSPQSLIDWLVEIGYFQHYNDQALTSCLQATFISSMISGRYLVDHGWDVKWLRLFFPKLPAHDLEVIIKRLYDSAATPLPLKNEVEGKMATFYDFCVENTWIFSVTLFAAETLVGSGFHLDDLTMGNVPELFHPLLNSLFHLAYLWVLTLGFSIFGRFAFRRFKDKYGGGQHFPEGDIEAGDLGGRSE